MKGVGILGGSFNPVHVGHLRLAVEALESLELNRVEMIPCFSPPHKAGKNILPFDLRLRLLRAAVKCEQGIEINALEAELPQPSFTFRTLQALSGMHPGRELWFLMGCGDLVHFDQWCRWEEVAAQTSLAVACRRPGDEELFFRHMARLWPESRNTGEHSLQLPTGRQAVLIKIPLLEVSSSLIRRMWRGRRSIRFLLPEACLEILAESADTLDDHWGTEND
jgi:nicotinate-nucleotide adenylyltransferase